MNLKRISKKTWLTVLSIVLVLVTMIGTSFGFFMKVNESAANYTTGVLSIELVTSGDGLGQTINLYNTVPMTDDEGKALAPYKFKITNIGTLNYKFDLKMVLDQELMETDGCVNNTLSYSNIKIQVNGNDPVLLSSLKDAILLANTTLAPKESITVEVKVWLDENTTNEAIGKHFHAKLATDGYAVYTESLINQEAVAFVSDKYNNASKTEVVNNNITYNYATEESLMADTAGNIRYYGPTPNNYIYFNCTDYNNQTKETCELWRIIGVFGDKVKIMRNDSIGKLAWDQDKNDNSSLTTYDNNWETSTLQKLLNTKYYEGKEEVTYYSGLSGTTTTSLNFATLGLKNDTTRNKIAEVKWNLGGHNNSSVFSDQIYTYERGTGRYDTTRPLEWTGKIGLMYPSDYGYATDFNQCTTQTLYNYSNTVCKDNDWIFKMMSGGRAWTLTPNSGSASLAWSVISTGYVASGYDDLCYDAGVHPVLFLNSEQIIKVGTGEETNPYQLQA